MSLTPNELKISDLFCIVQPWSGEGVYLKGRGELLFSLYAPTCCNFLKCPWVRVTRIAMVNYPFSFHEIIVKPTLCRRREEIGGQFASMSCDLKSSWERRKKFDQLMAAFSIFPPPAAVVVDLQPTSSSDRHHSFWGNNGGEDVCVLRGQWIVQTIQVISGGITIRSWYL